jgi:hypothetical protein
LNTTGRVVSSERRASAADRRACGGWDRGWLAGSAEVAASGGGARRAVTVTTWVIGGGRSKTHRLLASRLGRGHRPNKQLPGDDGALRGVVRRAGSSRALQTRFGCMLGVAVARCGGCALASGFRGARLDGASALCGRYSWRDHRMLTRPHGEVHPGSGSGQATLVNDAASDLHANDVCLTQRRSETIANVTDGHGCRPCARCGKTVAIVCGRGARSRFLVASGGGNRAEQWIRSWGGVPR